MPDIYDIANEMGLPGADPDVKDSSGDNPETDDGMKDLTNSAIEDRVADLFGQKETSKEQPDGEKKKEDTPAEEKDKDTDAGDQKKEPDQKKPDSFEEASKKTFLNEEGEIDSEKVGNYFLDKSKYSLDFSTIKQDPLDNITDKDGEDETPDTKYYKAVSDIVETLPDIIKEESEKGFKPEQTMQRLINTFNGFNAEREARKGLQSEREQLSTEFKNELNQVREDKLQSRIKNNTAELGAHYDNLIPGLKGVDVLNSFVLEKKYGGRMLDSWLQRDIKDFNKLPEEERKETVQTWFKNFQANKRDMATVAEFGRAMWLIEQIPGIVQHAQKIGATKKDNEEEVTRGKPSSISTQQGQKGRSGLDEFFGYDSVT